MASNTGQRFDPTPAPPGFSPEEPVDGLVYRPLRCECGGEVFRVTGWPRAVAGPGGFFWRSLTRVWREARQFTADGEPIDVPFEWPIETECRGCGRREERSGDSSKAERSDPPRPGAPREAYRCRDCRRGQVELLIGTGPQPSASEGVGGVHGIDIVARCHGCHHQSRIATNAPRPTDQQIRLDLLYGRR